MSGSIVFVQIMLYGIVMIVASRLVMAFFPMSSFLGGATINL